MPQKKTVSSSTCAVVVVGARDLVVDLGEERRVARSLAGVAAHQRVLGHRVLRPGDAVLRRLVERDRHSRAVRERVRRRGRADLEQHLRHHVGRRGEARGDLARRLQLKTPLTPSMISTTSVSPLSNPWLLDLNWLRPPAAPIAPRCR